jgi:hypothetical protein
MPISTKAAEADLYQDPDHWHHVMESLFVKSVQIAGLEPIRPVAQGSILIHAQIIKLLSEADLVLCDISQHNPNVFFELGVRTSLDLPIALVRDERTSLPFDTSGINTYEYDSRLLGWDLETQRQTLAKHVIDSVQNCAGGNPLWQHFGLRIKAEEPTSAATPLEATVNIMAEKLNVIQRSLLTIATTAQLDSTSKPSGDSAASIPDYWRSLEGQASVRDLTPGEVQRPAADVEAFITVAADYLNKERLPSEIIRKGDGHVHVSFPSHDFASSPALARIESIAKHFRVKVSYGGPPASTISGDEASTKTD